MNTVKKWFKNITSTDWVAISILIFAIAGMFVLPYLVTQKSWKYNLGVDDSNEIGDTLGGILGPFIGLISAFLVYLALREQINANKIIGDQFLDQKKEKFENVIYEEVLSEISSIISNLEKLDGNSFILESHEPALSKEEIVGKLYQNVVYEEKIKISNDSETNLFSKNLIKLVEVLELFNSNVQNEKAYLKIIKLRIIQLKNKPSLILKLSKSRNFELIVRLLKIEKKLLQEFEDEKLEIVSKQLEWYEKQLKTLNTKLSFQNKLKEIYTATYVNSENRRRDYLMSEEKKKEYEEYTTLLETEKNKTENEFRAFLLEIKELSQKEDEVKYQHLDDLISNPHMFY
jgi:phosphohistidine phosphatase SixA